MTAEATEAAEATQGEATGQQAQGATAPAQGAEPQEAQGASGEAEGEESVEALRAKLTKLEKDNHSYRQKEREREEAEQAKAKAEMPELERMRSENAELAEANTKLNAKLMEQSLKLVSSEAATKLGYRDPALAYRLLDRDAITFDEETGQPVNVEQMLREQAKQAPYLLAATDFGGGQRGTSPASGAPDMNTILRRAAGKQ